MTDTINNVPCELLETLIEQHITAHGFTNHTARQAQLILCAPSPAGVDGLNTDRNAAFKACPESGCDWGSFYLGWKARGEVEQAIIDGLRGENERIRLNIAEYNESIACYQSERDQQAQRIGELEGLLRKWRRIFDRGPGSGQLGVLRGQTDAALSAGKEGE